MSDSLASLRRKINGASDLKSVVRTMKALAASSITQFERSVLALADYDRAVQLGLSACLRNRPLPPPRPTASISPPRSFAVIVFGSDQGLVGQFNDSLADYVSALLKPLPGDLTLWSVGERIAARLADNGLRSRALFNVPNSVGAITPLIGRILVETESGSDGDHDRPLYIFHNRPLSRASYEPVRQRLLPLDGEWAAGLSRLKWPTKLPPQVVGDSEPTFRALIREYLFVSLFKSAAESLAAENASRLVSMQRAEKNIDELVERLTRTFQRLRQNSIDEELFDVVSGYESLSHPSQEPD